MNKLVSLSVVITARHFNPSVMSQAWLIRQGFVAEEEILPNFVFSDALVQVRTDRFALLVIPEQFQFFPMVEESEQQKLIQDKVGRIVNNLPHTPFRAVGLNFNWHIIPNRCSVSRLSRLAFGQARNPLYKYFQEENAQFGAYMSKDFYECRLKLDIKPLTNQETKEQLLQFGFNFHTDLRENEALVTQIESILSRWTDASLLANEIVTSFEELEHECLD